MKIFRSGNKKGIALVYIAILIVALIGFLGLVIDIGYMYVAKGQLQKAADSAALSGAARLPANAGSNPTAFGNFSAARREAWKFACKNVVVPSGTPVFLVDDYATDCNTLPSGVDLNNGNNPDGDIVVGHWNITSGFRAASFTNNSTINAVQVTARRTAEDAQPGIRFGNNPVGLFFGKIFSLLPSGGVGWPFMSAGARAVATAQPFIAPIPICLPSCSLDTPLDGQWGYEFQEGKKDNPPIYCSDENGSPPGQFFYFSPSSNDDPPRPGVAWTNFDISTCPGKHCNMPNKNEILPYLNGTKEAPDICNKNICTTNGNITGLIAVVEEMFNKNKRNFTFNAGGTTISVTGWHVLVPVVSDIVCGESSTPCPGAQGPGRPDNPGEPPLKPNPYFVEGFANVLITEVGTKGQKGIRLVGFANPRQLTPITVNCQKGPKTINRKITTIGAGTGSSCLNCNNPLDAPPFPPRLVYSAPGTE